MTKIAKMSRGGGGRFLRIGNREKRISRFLFLVISLFAPPVIADICSWTGGAGDGKMSTPGNWLNDAVPQNGSEVVFPSASGEIVNDIDSFSPKSITFGADVSEGIKISGNPITGLYAITNLTASVKPEIAASVTFAEGVEADLLWASSATNYVKWTGGMTAYTFKKRGASGDAGNIHIAGNVTVTKNLSDWGGYTEIDHFYIKESGSVLTIPNPVVQKTSPVNFSIMDAGAKVCVIGDLVSQNAGFGYEIFGTLEVSGWVVKNSTGNVHFSQAASSGYIKAYGIKEATSGQSGSFVITPTDNPSYQAHWIIGAGGMASGSDFITHDKSTGGEELRVHIYASDDFVIGGTIKLGHKGDSTSRWPMLHIHTEDLDGNPHTITMRGGFVKGNTVHPCMRIFGKGTFIDSAGELLPKGVEVHGSDGVVTYSLLPGRQSGNTFSLKSGTIFKVPASGNAKLISAYISANTTLAFNFTDASTPPCIVFSGTPTFINNITVSVTTEVSLPFNTSWTLTSAANITDLSKFTLDEETAKWATLSLSADKNLVLTRKPFFHIKIADSEAVDIPWNWVEDKVGTLGTEAVDFTSAVFADGANGIPVWQSYCLGLNPNDAQSVVLCEASADQPAAGTVRITARNLNVPEGLSGVAVTAYLDSSSNGADWTPGVASAPVSSGSATLASPEIGDGISFFE